MSQLSEKQNQEDYYNISDLLNKNCMDYAKYVLTSRAIPDLRDGCKPIHRRIVWSFYKNKLTNDKSRVKSANAVGGVLQYSPHGDASVYDACVRLANDSVVLNLIDGKGSFSSTTSRDVQAGASRYTEMRLSNIATELLGGIDKNVVDMVLNYDDTKYEPTVLPSSFPLILCNPNQGIGVGLSSSICSFNLNDVCDYTMSVLNGIQAEPLIPDFPTGGEIIFDKNTISSIDNCGRGSIKVRSKYYTADNSIIVTEIPYTSTREAIVEKVIDLVKQGKIKDIVDINDYTGINGLNITIDLKKNSNIDGVMAKLFKMTPLEDSFSCNFNILIDNKPQVLGVKAIIEEWIKFRKQCIKRELLFDIDKFSEEENELLGLKIVLLDIDKAIAIIRNSQSEKEAITNLMSQMGLNEKQAEYVADIKLRYLNQPYLTKKIERLGLLQESLFNMRDNVQDEAYYTNTIIQQLTEIKSKYGKPRMTTIITQDDTQQVSHVDLIEDYNCQIVLTEQSYLKKTLRYSESQKLKEGDIVLQQIPSNNKAKLLLFTDKANCYYINVYDLDTTQPSNLGSYLPSLLQLQDEKVIKVVSTTDFKGYVVFAFSNGKVAKITLDSYSTKTNRTKVVNAFNTDSPLVSITHIEKDDDFIAISSIDKILIVDSSLINSKGSKSSMGVSVLKSKNGSTMIEFKPCDADEDIKDYYRARPNSVGCYNRKDII